MTRYPDFADKFLAAIYFETETTGNDHHRAAVIIDKYNIDHKDQWISRVADEWEHFYFKEVIKVFGGYGAWSFRISGQGARKVEDEYPDETTLKAFLGVTEDDQAHLPGDLESLTARLIPAANRVVTLGDNRPERDNMLAELEKIGKSIQESNAMDPQEKSDVLVNVGAATMVVRDSETWLFGVMNYLVFERVKKAFEKSIEDVIRLAIIGSLIALATIILAIS